MNTNNAIFLLLKESLFDDNSGKRQFPCDAKFWKETYQELKNQAVLGLVSAVVPNHSEIPSEIRNDWNDYQRMSVVQYVQIYAAQTEATDFLRQEGIAVAVMKGLASACYYPVPEHRTMGDVDLIVKPKDYHRAIEVLKKNQFFLQGEEGAQYHTAFVKYGILFELHQSPASVHKDTHGEEIKKYILSGLDSVEINQLGPDQFPILPWKQNGMELIWHIRQHLYNGLGLRQIIDWMMFVNCMLDDDHFRIYRKDLEKCGLEQLAIYVTRMCQRHLGLREENITWCKEADDNVCDELLAFILEQGDFGTKKGFDDKIAKVLSGYNRPQLLLSKLQEIGKTDWKIVNKYPVLMSVAWIYAGIKGVHLIFSQKKGIRKFVHEAMLGKKRTSMFSKLYGTSKKRTLKDCVNIINGSFFKDWFKVAFEILSCIEFGVYELINMFQGQRKPNKKEQELVRKNVTFIYKSFERKKMAKALYKSIQSFYPGVKVIIADDSKVPLEIKGKCAEVINLSFNSGLSYGLNRALEQVKTPYVIRMDDDHLITRRTGVVQQIRFLQKHPEVDLVHFVLLNALRIKTPKKYLEKYYNQTMSYAPKKLKIPHMTKIDATHRVLAKGPNVYLARTNALKKIGYDDNIRMIDHDEFFYRAAGNIVGVVAEETRIFHRHNPFDSKYLKYRNDIGNDAKYIMEKQQKDH